MEKTINALKENVNKIKADLKGIETCAKDIVSCIEKNELIPDNLTDKMINSLNEHKQLKNSCSSLYSSIIDEPQELKSINILEECIENLEKKSAKNLASLFYKLHSDVEEVEALLDQEKRKLDLIFKETKEIEKLESLVNDYIVFAEAINSLKEKDSNDIIKIMKDLRGTFGDSLPMHAFILNDIYIADEDSKLSDHGNKEKNHEKTLSKSDIDNDSSTSMDSVEIENEAVTNTEEISDRVSLKDILIKNDAIIPNNYDYGLISSEISPKDDYKISAKSFKNDLNDYLDRNVATFVMYLIHEIGCVPSGLLKDFINSDNLSLVLFQLMNKGYVRKYSIVGKGEFYCESKRLFKAYKIKEVCNLLKISKKSYNGEYLDDTPSIITSRIGYTKLIDNTRHFFTSKSNISRSFVMSSEAVISFYESKDYGFDILISINITNIEEVDILEQYFIERINECGQPSHIIIISVDYDYSIRYSKALSEFLDLDISVFYAYSYEEDSLISCGDNSNVRFDSILWPVSDEVESISDIDEPVKKEDKITDDVEKQETETNNNDNKTIIEDEQKENVINQELIIKEKNPVSEIVDQVDKKELLSTIYKMINDNKLYCALSYLNSFTKNSTELYNTWRLFAYATNDPLKACRFSSRKMYDVYFKESTLIHDYLFTSAALRTFFYNNVEYDYEMKQLYEGNVLNLGLINECLELKNAFRTIVLFKDTIHKGMNEYADYRMLDNVNVEKHLKEIKNRAKEYYDNWILGGVKEKVHHERYIKTKKCIFDKEKDIAVYLNAIISDDKGYYSLMKDFICNTFMKDSSEANIVNIDNIKMDNYMDNAWYEAGTTMRNVNKSLDNFMKNLRKSLKNHIIGALDIMCEWLEYSGRIISDKEELGLNKYKKERDGLLSDLENSQKYFEKSLSSLKDEESKAGCHILVMTLDEMIRRINGKYNEDEYKYFYIDFLRADVVLLDKNYLPVMDMNFKTPRGLGISDRILDHASMELGTFEERLEDIFKLQGDDFGSARMILEYLGEKGDKLAEDNNYDLEESISYGKKGALKKKQEFLENLELMQSYGQIDNTVENKKDKYLQITNSAFDFCFENSNFGFFRSVADGFLSQIREDAKQYENTIVSELTEYKEQIKNNENVEGVLTRLEDVQKMLDIQNYTVAQDLLSRIKKGDLETGIEILPQDYLVKFIDQYDNNVTRTADGSKALVSLVSHKLRNPMNKDTKDGRKLIDNWPMPGHSLDPIKLKILLSTLGFSVESVVKSERIGKVDNYKVKLLKPQNGRKINYKHPIAAFGSYAINDDFRVAFITGKNDADRLIMNMKELGNAKHTILIVDYAISLRDRRRLARKIKELYPTKVFGVIDRTMILFLAENYNAAYINQMLMSVMMPFSYVQPYVWDSGNVMPPEIFMGRDKELKDIEAPTGVNIVYGGRQLGKSALLKMARNDIDHDENGRRAVYVDIKGKDYRQSALKIGQALHDEGILDADFKSDDWDELARLIKNRLNDEKRKIPYLLLLLDEADAFIESCEKVNYSPLDSLKDIQNVGAGRFKFVIAGLRNIVKFTKNALANNSVLTHLGSTTIVPFNYAEARELLEKPLYYLGLRFPKEKESLVSLIFANANYFPGLIQLYCAKLVEAMTKGDYAGYNQSDVPIYYVEQEHIKKVLAEEGFLQQVREKFEITLRLDEDNYYYIIALLLASLYHDRGYSNGYSAYDILEEGRTFGINKIEDAGLDKLSVFLDELCELNILRRLKEDKFVFNQYNFFQMMGSRDEVDNKLLECMEA